MRWISYEDAGLRQDTIALYSKIDCDCGCLASLTYIDMTSSFGTVNYSTAKCNLKGRGQGRARNAPVILGLDQEELSFRNKIVRF